MLLRVILRNNKGGVYKCITEIWIKKKTIVKNCNIHNTKTKSNVVQENNINNKTQMFSSLVVSTRGEGEGCNWACMIAEAQNQSP